MDDGSNLSAPAPFSTTNASTSAAPSSFPPQLQGSSSVNPFGQALQLPAAAPFPQQPFAFTGAGTFGSSTTGNAFGNAFQTTATPQPAFGGSTTTTAPSAGGFGAAFGAQPGGFLAPTVSGGAMPSMQQQQPAAQGGFSLGSVDKKASSAVSGRRILKAKRPNH